MLAREAHARQGNERPRYFWNHSPLKAGSLLVGCASNAQRSFPLDVFSMTKAISNGYIWYCQHEASGAST